MQAAPRTKIGQGFLAFLSARAEDERERIMQLAKDDRAAAHKAARKSGRKPKLNATQQRRARELMSQGEGVRGVAEQMNVHYSIFSRLQRQNDYNVHTLTCDRLRI